MQVTIHEIDWMIHYLHYLQFIFMIFKEKQKRKMYIAKRELKTFKKNLAYGNVLLILIVFLLFLFSASQTRQDQMDILAQEMRNAGFPLLCQGTLA